MPCFWAKEPRGALSRDSALGNQKMYQKACESFRGMVLWENEVGIIAFNYEFEKG